MLNFVQLSYYNYSKLQVTFHLSYTISVKKFLFLLITGYWLLVTTAPLTIYAQNITIPPVGVGHTCDICGKCEGQTLSLDQEEEWKKCIACSQREGYKYTVFGCLPSSPGGFVQTALRIITSLVGGIAFLALLYGGGMILTSSGSPERLEAGKSILRGAILGILLVIFAVFILQFLGVTVFGLPGFGG